MDEPSSSTMQRILDILNIANAGDRRRAREEFAALWSILPAHGDPVDSCTLAHLMADVQDDPSSELVWDQRALEIADRLTPSDREQWPESADKIAGFYPSLYLNLAVDYLKLNDRALASDYLSKAQECAHLLPDSDYGTMIRDGITWVESRLSA